MASISYSPLPSGKKRWIVNWYEPTLEGKSRMRRKVFYTKREAQDFKREVETQIKEHSYASPNRITLHQHVMEWLETSRLRPNTLHTYEYAYNKWVRDQLGSVRLQDLSSSQLQKLLNQLHDQGLAPNTIQSVRTMLSSTLSTAVKWYRIRHNPMRGVTLPGVKERQQYQAPKDRVWTPDQLQYFLEQTKGHRHHVMWTLMSTYGLRPGEAVALRWDQVDLERKTLTVSVTQTRDRNGKRTYGEPKSPTSNRELPLTDEMVELLRKHRAWQLERWMLLGRRDGLEYLFPGNRRNGKPISTINANVAFRKEVLRLGLPEIGLHGLRHTMATRMTKKGVNPRVLQQILGHSHVATTMRIYVHVDEDDMRDALQRISS